MLKLARKMVPHTKYALRRFGRLFGLDIRVSGLNSREDLRFVHFLRLHRIDTVLDVGANKGQFAQQLFKAGYKGRIISFEPLPDAHKKLQKAASAFGERWSVGPRVALSDRAGTATYFVTQADTSSSLLEPLKSFVEVTPIAKVEEHIEVRTDRLDVLVSELSLDESRVFLKLDVQGSEAKVLAGATQMLRSLYGVLIEMSFVNLYEDQSSAIIVQQKMADSGFEIWDIWRGYFNPNTKRLNQVDALFFRSDTNICDEG